MPKKLLQSSYRKEMWKNVLEMMDKIEKVLPISSMHVMGSFASKKRRPADIDFIVLLKTKNGRQNKNWSVDLVIAPDNRHGKYLQEDCAKWMKQKYGSKKCEILRLR
ncbi:hypothetical protein A3B05_02370 [Candidatus Giovannonibacteria bacterium RIFCSPLOWO2_01_FULL_43_160]|uniref:Polymerase nucleotidyl transferase domain-containing protein n=2 Tax=Candidatus Giovannoniibacteriota TaxID=1752738 RepID=A0A0G1IVL1_9BACT|nr:MAG: hypothetical protein UV72_C0002G0039 [Candidatus Giovannonibacteria bacterium GW2011_GWB1_43_13]KKS99207.1 MAG: hypothetical protein UV75_C0008G0041 [Candidatus Giovannonibacteria bacterium GW2011_GWA1_43_15]KKT21201.1 MAG: hypothetical protein UW05_C0015G0004 [Candidatus Giovannonibacteria bacterium GW2011_GWC2_43_8]KKT63008.1 MAG: hypothetical protein UW55_C0007G0048 [Candidatus Giovannonibacteria bacterium GW2011_GWA2_44_26]OGF58466.1 MAG: hypothetical protein A2652_01705 [Candidatus